MPNYKLLIAYEGTKYKGWQRQKDGSATIQGKIEDVLARFTGEYQEVNGSGRTDAGVHAEGQVASVRLRQAAEPEEIRYYLNRYLPDDIAVLSVESVPEDFHARFAAKKKTYRYVIHESDVPDV